MLTEEDLHALYLWVDEVPLTRPKRSIARDFADGVNVAEIVKYYFPRLVDLHNYTSGNSMSTKLDNWNTLNRKVFRKLHFEVPEDEIKEITGVVPGAVERFLRALQTKIVQIRQKAIAQGLVGPDAAAATNHSDAGDQRRSGSGDDGKSAAQQGRDHRHNQPPPPLPQNGARGGNDSDKDRTINTLRESVHLLTAKISQLEELLRIRDEKIASLQDRLNR